MLNSLQMTGDIRHHTNQQLLACSSRSWS